MAAKRRNPKIPKYGISLVNSLAEPLFILILAKYHPSEQAISFIHNELADYFDSWLRRLGEWDSEAPYRINPGKFYPMLVELKKNGMISQGDHRETRLTKDGFIAAKEIESELSECFSILSNDVLESVRAHIQKVKS